MKSACRYQSYNYELEKNQILRNIINEHQIK